MHHFYRGERCLFAFVPFATASSINRLLLAANGQGDELPNGTQTEKERIWSSLAIKYPFVGVLRTSALLR